jgi:hypothetical protein
MLHSNLTLKSPEFFFYFLQQHVQICAALLAAVKLKKFKKKTQNYLVVWRKVSK